MDLERLRMQLNDMYVGPTRTADGTRIIPVQHQPDPVKELMEIPDPIETAHLRLAEYILGKGSAVSAQMRGRELEFVTLAVEKQWRRFAPERFLKLLTFVAESKRGNRLYKQERQFLETHYDFMERQTRYYLAYTCPSTGKLYVSGVPQPEGDNPDAAMAWKHNLTLKQYAGITAEA